MPVITIDLPFPVSVNRIWRSGQGKTYRSEPYLRWITQANGHWLEQKPKLKIKRIDGLYTLHVVYCPPDKRSRDLDNLVKCLNDFAQGAGIVLNDAQCRELHLVWGSAEEAPLGARLTFTSMS